MVMIIESRNLFDVAPIPDELSQGLKPPSKATAAAMAVSGALDIISFKMLIMSSLTDNPGKLKMECYSPPLSHRMEFEYLISLKG